MKKNILLTAALAALLLTSAFTIKGTNKSANGEGENEITYTEKDRDIKTGYLLRENFIVYPQASESWETLNMPRGVNVALADVKSGNTSIPTYIKKNFVRQTGDIVCDLKFSLLSDISRGYITLLGHKNDKEVKGVYFLVENNVIQYVDIEGNKTALITMDFESSVGLQIKANAGKGLATICVNGEEVLTNTSLNDDVVDLCGIKIGFDKSDIGGFKMSSINIRKGYNLFEDFSTVGYVKQVAADFDFNRQDGVFVNATVNDHTTQNDNNGLALLAFDNDDSTYWEHNKNYAITKNVYFMINYPSTISADTLRYKFASYYKGYIEISVCSPSGSWGAISSEYRYFTFETTTENDYTLNVQIAEPKSFTILAIGFTVGPAPYDISSGEIKLATANCYCKNPKPVTINTFPSNWTKDLAPNTSIGIDSLSSDLALDFVNNNGQKACSASVDFKEIGGDVTCEFTSSYKDDKNNNRAGLVTKDGNFIGIETKDKVMNFVSVVNGSSKYVPIVNEAQNVGAINLGLWQRFILKYDSKSNSVNVDYNGWCPIDDIVLDDAFKNCVFNSFKVTTSRSKTEMLIDSIQVYETIPESNVPDVIPCDTGDTQVTMEVCSLWREGTHTGWGILDNIEMCGRETLLGYYDEGTASVADWEVKIAREHGVSNFMFCWYRKGNGAIKTSNYSDAIWDGLFKSKFRNDINFSIMLENASSTTIGSYSDLMNNLMPYFIETFFKNPNYQRTKDGKPILYVYIADLSSSIGDANEDGKVDKDDVSFALDAMKQACVDAGLPGLHIATETRIPSATTTQKIETFGYDSIFSYTWCSGYFNVNDDYTLAYSKNAILTQMSALENTTIIPAISKQWDPSAWMNSGFNNEGATYTYDLEHYRQFALWVKDIAEAQPIDDAGTKMIMLDNWNEYSEGHWLMPSYDAPKYKKGRMAYGYLDILREIYGIYEFEHTDYFPREDGYGVYDTWFPMAWDEPISKYLELFGEPVDNSVADSEYIDWNIGHDTCGGSTAYINEVTSNLVEAVQANRIVLKPAAVQYLQSLGKEVTIKSLYGSVTISSEEFAKLDSNKALEIVLNLTLNSTAAAILLRKQNVNFTSLSTIDYSLKQGGVSVGIKATISISDTLYFDKVYIMQNNALTAVESAINVNCDCSLALITL